MKGKRFKRSTGSRQYDKPPPYLTAIKKRWIAIAAFGLLCLFGLVFSILQLTRYYNDYRGHKQQSEQLREAYHQVNDSEQAVKTESEEGPFSDFDAFQGYDSDESISEENWDLEPASPLEDERSKQIQPKPYPQNPYNRIQAKFKGLLKQNKDVIGWLHIEDMLDEAVVQRDNQYYLRRDYLGYHNANGALFLDERIGLNLRPPVMFIYGHNMKTGAMFGNLRYYRRLDYYKQHPFITFDTLYEDGQYIVFAAGDVALHMGAMEFTGIFQLSNSTVSQWETAIERLMLRSVFRGEIDILPEDQLLFLVTCTADDNTRSVVAARRVRPDEDLSHLSMLVSRARLQ